MRRLAVLSMHTSPLAQPGTGDGGGMNVYVRELSSALARSGVICDVYTRRWSLELPDVVSGRAGLRGPPRRRRTTGPGRQGDAARPRRGVHRIGHRPHDRGRRTPDHLGVDDGPPRPSTPTTGSRDSPATPSSTASGCPSCRPSTPSTGSRRRRAPRRSRAPSRAAGRGPSRRSSAARMPCSPRARRGRPARGAVRRRPRPGRGRPAWGRPRLFLARRPALCRGGRSASRATARSCCSSAGSSRSKAPTWPLRAFALLASADSDAQLVVVGGPSGPRGEAEVALLHATVDKLPVSPVGCALWRRSPTSCSRLTTGRRTVASCPRVRSPSAWSRSRPPPAAHRSWRPRSAA